MEQESIRIIDMENAEEYWNFMRSNICSSVNK